MLLSSMVRNIVLRCAMLYSVISYIIILYAIKKNTHQI